MSEFTSEKSEMSSVVFVQSALRERIAPPTIGSVKQRIDYAARKMGWKFSRVKAAWYADERLKFHVDEMRDVERFSGLQYALQEMRTNDQLIAKIDAFMEGHDADFYSAFRSAFRSVLGLQNRTRT